jgi:uncharacterized protein (TIRG00374 family)
MRLAINLTLSLGMLALCTWLVWPAAVERGEIHEVLARLRWADFAPYLAGYAALQIVVHLCRSLRWNHLLAPLRVRVPPGPLLAISSVGFMAILALPARLGEFVRPGLLRQRGYLSGSAALGTVAVERIIDGLFISVMVFGAFLPRRGAAAPTWMMPAAYGALGVFAVALAFLVFAMRRPEPTVRFCVALTLLPRFAPRLATAIEHRLLDMIRGFAALGHGRSLVMFLIWTIAYWGCNGLCMWLLARAFGLPLSLIGAFATMGLLGIGISLPNAPGMVGQFQWFTILGLSLYLGFDPFAQDGNALHAAALTYAIALHLLQVAWYVAAGALGLATPWVSFHDLWAARKEPPDTDETAPVGVPAAQASGASGSVRSRRPVAR